MRVFLGLFFVFGFLFSFSQNEKTLFNNNLKQLIDVKDIAMLKYSTEKDVIKLLDSSKKAHLNNTYVLLYHELMYNHYLLLSDIDKTKKNLQNLSIKAKANNWNYLNGLINVEQGFVLYNENKIQDANLKFRENIALLDTFTTIDTVFGYKKYNLTGLINSFMLLGKYQEAINILKDLELKTNKNLEPNLYSYVLSTLGSIHMATKNDEEAIKYFLRSAEMAEEKVENNRARIATAYGNIGTIYHGKKDFENSIKYFEKALGYLENEPTTSTKIFQQVMLGHAYFDHNQPNEAAKFAKLSYQNMVKENNNLYKPYSHMLLTRVYTYQDSLDKALIFIDSAIDFFEKTKQSQNQLNKCYELKSNVLIKQEKFDEATKILLKKIQISDSLTIANDMQNLQKTLTEYETEKKEQQIINLDQTKQIQELKIEKSNALIFWLVISLILFTGIFVLVFYYQKRVSTLKQAINSSKLLRLQFNPHFLNNAFASLQASLINNDASMQDIEYTQNLASLSRLILEGSFKDEWTINEEVDLIKNYVFAQQYKHNNQLNIHLNLPENYNENILIPSSISQIPIENMIEHGDLSQPLFISLMVDKESIRLVFENIINQNISAKDNHVSRGSSIVKERLAIFEKIHSKKIDYQTDIKENKYTLSFKIPIIHTNESSSS